MLCLHLFVYSLDVMQNYFDIKDIQDTKTGPICCHQFPFSIQQDCVDVNSRNKETILVNDVAQPILLVNTGTDKGACSWGHREE